MQADRLPTWRSAIENPQPFVRALCIVMAVALIGFELWQSIASYVDKPDVAKTGPRTTGPSAANAEQIAAADLFGHAASQNGNLPQTDLQVTLRAVFAASNPASASAVIETGDGSTQIVKVGGAIGSAATLQTVYPNRVVLMRNGVLETLYFPAPQDSVAPALAQTAPPPDANAPADPNLPAGASAEEIKRAAILQRLEELRARSPR